MEKINRIINNVNEKFYKDTVSSIGRNYREIFVNPSKEDIRDIGEFGGNRFDGDIRFIADKRKKEVYVTAGDVFHRDIIDMMGYSDEYEVMNHFSGMGWINGGKIKPTDWSEGFFVTGSVRKLIIVIVDILDGEYDWMERYNFNLSGIKKESKSKLEYYERIGQYDVLDDLIDGDYIKKLKKWGFGSKEPDIWLDI